MKQEEFEGFVPTSTDYRWRGKYRCIYCKSSGYIDKEWMRSPRWWGHRHGNNCRRKNE